MGFGEETPRGGTVGADIVQVVTRVNDSRREEEEWCLVTRVPSGHYCQTNSKEREMTKYSRCLLFVTQL